MDNSSGRLGARLKRETAADLVRAMIADGTLKPGAPAPSGAALARETGYSSLTCRAALRTLLADGTLTQGPSANARPRVTTWSAVNGTGASTVRVPLSSALAARRRAAGLTQPQLAALLGMSVTTVGHAETGRLWQSREFWQRADRVLDATGDLLHVYEEHQARVTRSASEVSESREPPVVLPVNITITADGVVVVWPNGTESVARPPALSAIGVPLAG